MDKKPIVGFHKLERPQKLAWLQDYCDLNAEDLEILSLDGALDYNLADTFVENSLGSFEIPLGIGKNFLIDDEEYVIPMAVEESSVIAAASNAAKWIQKNGGFHTEVLGTLMIGQIQLLDVPSEDMNLTESIILNARSVLIDQANSLHSSLVRRGGGVRDLKIFKYPQAEVPFMVVQFLIDPCDAMGANLINTLCESMAPKIQQLTSARIGLKILSNLADHRRVRATCKIAPETLSFESQGVRYDGSELVQRIHEAFVFADTDPYRAATHNKGIMNGIDPVVIATGNDWRAVSAGVHAYAAQTGRYRSVSSWTIDPAGYLIGSIEIPMQLGTVGGVTRLHPKAKLALKMLRQPSANRLACVAACVGLASNLAALRALTSTGIQQGHMRLHASNLALLTSEPPLATL